MLATKIMAPTQRTTGRVAAPKIIVIMFTMTAMVGNRLRQIKVPRLDAYERSGSLDVRDGPIADEHVPCTESP